MEQQIPQGNQNPTPEPIPKINPHHYIHPLHAILVILIVASAVGYGVWAKVNNSWPFTELPTSNLDKTSYIDKPTQSSSILKSYSATFCSQDDVPTSQILDHQQIGLMRISPQLITANKLTEVEVSADVGDNFGLVSGSVELLRLNDSDQILGSYGQMRQAAGEKDSSGSYYVFTSKITLNEPQQKKTSYGNIDMINLAVTAKYQGLDCQPVSNLRGRNSLPVYPPAPTAKEVVLQMAGYLEQGNYMEAQKLLRVDYRTADTFAGLEKGNKSAMEFAKLLREAEYIQDSDNEVRQTIKMGLTKGEFEITMWRTPEGWIFDESFPSFASSKQ